MGRGYDMKTLYEATARRTDGGVGEQRISVGLFSTQSQADSAGRDYPISSYRLENEVKTHIQFDSLEEYNLYQSKADRAKALKKLTLRERQLLGLKIISK